MKITFKTTKPTGRYRAFDSEYTEIKADGKVCGTFGSDKDGNVTVRLMAVKDGEKITDDNPNCPWKWVTLKARFQDLGAAKEWCVQNLPKITTFEIWLSEGLRFKDMTNEGIVGLVGKGIRSLRSSRTTTKLQDIVDDYTQAMREYWDDFFDAAEKYSAAKREVDAARRDYAARAVAAEKLDRAEKYLTAVEKFNKNIEATAYRRAKSIIGGDVDLRSKFEGMMADAAQAMNAEVKRRYRELTDRDAAGRKDLHDRDAKKRDWLFDDEEDLDIPEKGEKPKRDKTLSELGVHDAAEFALETEDRFWAVVDKMSKENLKVMFNAAKRRYREIEESLADELRGYRAELKDVDGKSDSANMAKARKIKQDIAMATKGATEDQEILLDRMERIKAKIETEFHGVR